MREQSFLRWENEPKNEKGDNLPSHLETKSFTRGQGRLGVR